MIEPNAQAARDAAASGTMEKVLESLVPDELYDLRFAHSHPGIFSTRHEVRAQFARFGATCWGMTDGGLGCTIASDVQSATEFLAVQVQTFRELYLLAADEGGVVEPITVRHLVAGEEKIEGTVFANTVIPDGMDTV